MPATMPNPIWETTNQGQSIRWLSTGFRNSENAMDQARPQDGRDHAAQQNRATRKHRKHGAIEKPDQKRRDQVDRRWRRSEESE